MGPAVVGDPPHFIGGEPVGIEADSQAAVDLDVEEGRGDPLGRHVSGSRQNGKAPSHPEGDGDSRHNQRLFCQARKKSVHSRIP